MSSNTLPLSIVCDVSISISPVAAAAPTFNQALIVGPSTVIPSSGANSRLRQYTSLAAMTSDGFSTSNPEYLAAQLYFGQTPAPQYLWIGRQDLTSIQAATVGTSGGTGYQAGDILTVVDSGAQGGEVQVAVTGGVVTGVTVVAGNQGTGYTASTDLATTGGHGTGAQVSITTIGETPLQSLQACRAASAAWWACMVTDAVTADHEAIATWIQAATPQGCYFFTTADTAVLNNTAGNVLATLQAAKYSRVFGIYSTTQGSAAPNNAYAADAAMGVAMGRNTGLANSYFTMKFKPLTGVLPENLTPSQVATIEGLNGNLYLSYANTYEWLEQGIQADGQFFDEVLNIDMLASDIQYSVVNLLVANPSIPQTNAGEAQIIAAVAAACDRAVTRGFVGPGVWTGQTILALTAGTALPKGYLCQAQSFTTQSSGDRAARKAMPVYVALIEAGAMHSITIGVYVQR